MAGFPVLWSSQFGPFSASPHLFGIAGTKTECSAPGVAWQVQSGIIKSGSSLSLLVMPVLVQPRFSVAFLAGAAHCSPILSLVSTRTPKSLSTQLLPSHAGSFLLAVFSRPFLRALQIRRMTIYLPENEWIVSAAIEKQGWLCFSLVKWNSNTFASLLLP